MYLETPLEPLRARLLTADQRTLTDQHQVTPTLGDTPDFAQLGPHAVFKRTSIAGRDFYVQDSEDARLQSVLHSIDRSCQTNGERFVEQELDKLEEKRRFVVTSGDMFEISWPDRRIIYIYRNLNDLNPNRDDAAQDAPQQERPVRSDVPVSYRLSENFGGATPASIPGGTLVTPRVAWQMIAGRQGERPVVLAAFDNELSVPTAYNMEFAAAPGDFDDTVQKKLAKTMIGLGASPTRPVIVYCHHDRCWMSYNLALRLIHLGYKDIQWMRNGWEGWLSENLPLDWARQPPKVQ